MMGCERRQMLHRIRLHRAHCGSAQILLRVLAAMNMLQRQKLSCGDATIRPVIDANYRESTTVEDKDPEKLRRTLVVIQSVLEYALFHCSPSVDPGSASISEKSATTGDPRPGFPVVNGHFCNPHLSFERLKHLKTSGKIRLLASCFTLVGFSTNRRISTGSDNRPSRTRCSPV